MDARQFPPVMVDREKELGILKQVMKDAEEGRGNTVLISGDVGVGKTRLASEFAEMCQKEGFTVLSSICIGNNEPAYLPVLSALQTYAKKVRERSEMYVPLGLASFQSLEIEELNPDTMARERTRMLEHLLRQFTGISRKQPVLFMVDDLHLADSATLSFFHYLGRNIKTEKIIAIATYVEEYARTETIFASTMRNMSIERLCTVLKLEAFSRKEIQQIVEQLGLAQVDEIARYVHDRTSGNPFFVIEFLTAIQSSGLSDIESIKRMEMPDTVKDLVKYRFSGLSEKARKVLTACAVLGRVFEYEVLDELAGLKEEELLDAIEELISQNFLVETEEFEEGYKFVSNTAHEVIYEDITGARRRIMHQKAAEVLEKLHGRDEQFWSEIARHYRACHNKTKFLEYAVKAGRCAARRFANAEAAELFESAIEVLGETEEEVQQKVEILWDLAEVLELDGKYDFALEVLRKRFDYTLQRNPVEAGKTCRKLSEIFISKGEYESALREVERAEELLTGIPEARFELAGVWSAKGYVYERKGEYKSGIEWQMRALAVFEELNAQKEVANANHRIGAGHWYIGEYDSALEFYQRALEIREKIGDVRGVANTYNNIGVVYYSKGNYERAIDFYHKGAEIQNKLGDVFGVAMTYTNLGLVYSNKGDYDKAVEYYLKSLEIEEKIGDLWGVEWSYQNLGVIYRDRGDHRKALEFYSRSLAIGEEIGDMRGMAWSYGNIGSEYLTLGQFDDALKLLKKSLEIGEKIDQKDIVCIGMLTIALAYCRKGEFEICEEYLEEGKEIADELDAKDKIGYYYIVRGECLLKKGAVAEGIASLRTAIAILEEMGAYDISYYETLFEIGKWTKDKQIMEKALAFFERIGNVTLIEKARKELGGA
ncbi:MAG: tetratricopeptide repeat protein [Thermoplasmata archaeon]|nr:tetratricopeptide repeat protein [Thermoplasmata archaeon]